jgi:hypothetical protein
MILVSRKCLSIGEHFPATFLSGDATLAILI